MTDGQKVIDPDDSVRDNVVRFQENTILRRAKTLIAGAETERGRTLTPAQRREWLTRNTHWSVDTICEAVDNL